MLGRIMHYDWDGIIEDFTSHQGAFQDTKTQVPYQLAARAFAERGCAIRPPAATVPLTSGTDIGRTSRLL